MSAAPAAPVAPAAPTDAAPAASAAPADTCTCARGKIDMPVCWFAYMFDSDRIAEHRQESPDCPMCSYAYR